jgi:hypothetical protein
VEHRSVLPDLGCYEARYGLTGRVAWSLAVILVLLAIAILVPEPLPLEMIALAPAVLALPAVIRLASRMTALRADPAGITLGADPAGWPVRRIPADPIILVGHNLEQGWPATYRVPAVFVPWADVERIILYRGPGSRLSEKDVPCIGIQRRAGAPALPWGNTPATGCPAPGVAAGTSRPITAWRLNRERLAAVTLAVAPGIPIIDASAGPRPGVEGPGQGGA